MAQDRRGRRRGGAGAVSTANADTIRFPLAGTALDARGAARSNVGAEALTFPLAVFAVHWLVVQVAASLAYRYGTPNPTVSPPYQVMPPPLTGLAHTLVEPLRQWDGLWYKLIAEQGYGGPAGQFHKAAFWPLFPWLMDYGSRLTGWTVDTVGYLVGHLAFAVALVLLYRLVALDFDRAVARRTLVAIAFFPTALFFSAVYTESLFLALAVGTLLAARLGNWWLAGIAGALAGLTRSYGVLLILPMAVLVLQQHRLDVRRWFPGALAAAMPALGPVIFGWHLERARGDWRLFLDAQTGWDRRSVHPIDTLRCAVNSCPPLYVDGADWSWLRTLADNPVWSTFSSYRFRLAAADSDTLELVCFVLFAALAVIGLRALPPYQSAYLIPGLIIPLYQPSEVHALMSMPRFGLTLFPLFVVLALLLRHRALALPALAVSTLLLVLLTAQFAHWYWVS